MHILFKIPLDMIITEHSIKEYCVYFKMISDPEIQGALGIITYPKINSHLWDTVSHAHIKQIFAIA